LHDNAGFNTWECVSVCCRRRRNWQSEICEEKPGLLFPPRVVIHGKNPSSLGNERPARVVNAANSRAQQTLPGLVRCFAPCHVLRATPRKMRGGRGCSGSWRRYPPKTYSLSRCRHSSDPQRKASHGRGPVLSYRRGDDGDGGSSGVIPQQQPVAALQSRGS
jgi:hypothetical protein